MDKEVGQRSTVSLEDPDRMCNSESVQYEISPHPSVPKFARMESGASALALLLSVGPISCRHFPIAPGATSSIATIRPLDMKEVSFSKKGLPL